MHVRQRVNWLVKSHHVRLHVRPHAKGLVNLDAGKTLVKSHVKEAAKLDVRLDVKWRPCAVEPSVHISNSWRS